MIKAWIRAFRLRTLPLALASVGLGSVLAYGHDSFHKDVLIWTIVTALLLQILSNLANDYGDYVKGTDDDVRADRALASGQISPGQMKTALWTFVLLCLGSGGYLIYLAFGVPDLRSVIFFLTGILAITAALKYTVGKGAYGYNALGDVAVLVFFGWVAVSGTMVLHEGNADNIWMSLLPATAFGLLSVGVLNINNIRDIDGDKSNAKITVAVKLGRRTAEQYQMVTILAAFLLGALFHYYHGELLVSYYALFPVYFWHWLRLRSFDHSDRPVYNRALKQFVLLNILWVVLFSMYSW